MSDLSLKKILVVEDNPISSVGLAHTLNLHGFKTVVANSGIIAIDLVDEEDFLAILMDSNINSGIDAIEASRIIISRKDIPIIFHTTLFNDDFIKKSKIIPHYGYVIKNSGDALLIASIELALEQHSNKNKLNHTMNVLNKIIENTSEVYWIEDLLENRVTYVTPSFEKIFGYKANQISKPYNKFQSLILPEDRQNVLKFHENFISKSGEDSIEFRLKGLNQKIQNIFVRLFSMEEKDNKITKIIGFAEIRTKLKNYELKLINKDKELKSIINNLPLPVIIGDSNLIIQEWNREAERMFGYSKEEVIGISAYDLIIPTDEHKTVLQLNTTTPSDEGVITISNWNKCKNDTLILCQWWNTPIYDNKNTIIGYISIAQNITERNESEVKIKNQLAQKEILLKEIHHRTKNNMAMICSLLDLHSSYVSDPIAKSHLKVAQSRVHGMMVLYDKLLYSKDFKNTSLRSYIVNLIYDLKELYDAFDVELKVEIEDLELVTSTLFPIGIIVNEIVSNSYKHAFTKISSGIIQIQGKLQTIGIYELEIFDNGIGRNIVDPREESKGFGSKLIEILSNQIRAVIKPRIQECGFGYTIQFPISD